MRSSSLFSLGARDRAFGWYEWRRRICELICQISSPSRADFYKITVTVRVPVLVHQGYKGYCVRIYSYEYCGALGELELTSGKQTRQKAHIFVATDNSDLRPLIVVVNSTLNSPTNSECIVIVVLVPRELASQVEHTFQRLFSGYRSWLIIDSTSFDAEKVARLPGVLATWKTKRKELFNPYNFAAFYIAAMPKYAHVTKAVYLDIDTVVQGDLHELLENCCNQNTPIAVVEDCSQRVRTYISTSVLAKVLLEETLPSTDDTARLSHAGEACVFNRGVLVLNLPIWRVMNITKQIENWMEIHDTHERSLLWWRHFSEQAANIL